ncbi:hypothetical protein FPZ42_18535 [Mucilaginibacter achroorhodeus]|uniref:Uncharacterized protein n=1 Tax=Mucilaginibacter achroorhodeus TaxID=2599294 RepID=A0A563TXL6_9SPHI|nr:hypothetical protein [Mucilaginibacter achroorhodeus]TWR24003.1 hypothetical protein FPZ42_18535 [Mucilaginibacter achroorhodeus]
MSYKLFDINGHEVNQGDLQQKEIWYEEGISFEQAFIDKYGNALSLEINPEKKTNRFTVDLLNTNTGNLGDLKTQTTPFFQSSFKYGIDPQYAVTFNHKDYIRYSKFYDNLELYFWIDWYVVKFEGKQTIKVDPMNGV